jgi:hypothetical protein
MILSAWDSVLQLWHANPLAQTVGLFASLGYIFATLQHDDKKLFATQLVGTVLFVAHYGLLGAWVAALGYSVSIGRNVLAYLGWVTAARRLWVTLAFFVAYGTIGVFKVQVWQDALPLLSSCSMAFAFFNLSGVRMRMLFLFSQTLFIAYAIYVGSIGGMITVGTEMVLTSLTIWRLARRATLPQGQ